MGDFSVTIMEPDETTSCLGTTEGQENIHKPLMENYVWTPKSPIEVVKRNSDWCVLSVARGNGPRVVEEWIVANKSKCFDEPTLLLSMEQRPNACDTNDERQPAQSEVCPVLANPHSSACAHSLILAARTPSILQKLTHLRVTVRCLVKGHHKPGTRLVLSNVMQHRKCQTTATCLEVVPSNSVGHVSLLVAYNSQPNSTYIGARQIQSHLKEGGWPVLGATRDCHAFRGEKMCLSVVGLEYDADGMEKRQSFKVPPVPKLRRILQKEERFWKERQGGDDATALAYFGEELPKPVEYENERATFDGLEFRVTPAVMIPRKGSTVLVDRVESFYSDKTPSKPPRVLDLGTGCGNLLLAALQRLRHLKATGIGIDAAQEALDVCNYNIAALGMKDLVQTQLGIFKDLHLLKHGPFDVVVCNPPYIRRGGRKGMDAVTVAYEPERALFVDREEPNVHYEDVLNGLVRGELLRAGSLVVFEVCKENSKAVAELMSTRSMEGIKFCKDWKECIRTVEGVYNPKSVPIS